MAVKSLEGQYGKQGWNFHVVKTGDELDIGNGKKLQFVEMRMLHWPDSMAEFLTGAHVDHWLDGEHHARNEQHASASMTIVKNLRLFMELATYAMTAKIANHTITILLAMLLDSMTDITNERVWLGNLHTDFQTFLGYANQLLLFRSSLAANDEHAAGVSVIAIYDGCHIHIDDITLFEHILFYLKIILLDYYF